MEARPEAPTTAGTGRGLVGLFRNGAFARLFFAGATSAGGFSIGLISLTWVVYATTGSSLDIAFLGVAFLVASVGLSLVSGTLVDRQDRRRLMIVADLVRAASLGVLVLLFLAVGFSFPAVLVVMFLLGAFTTVFQPAERALTPELIPADRLADANGLIGTSSSVIGFAGNAAGGLLVGIFGIAVALGVNSLTFLVSAVLLFSIRLGHDAAARSKAARAARSTSFVADTRAGFRYLGSNRGLLSLTISAGFGNFFGSMVLPFLVLYATDVLRGGAAIYGLLGALLALGWAPGSLLVGRLRAIRHAGMVWILVGTAEGLLVLVYVFVPVLAVAALVTFVFGILNGFANTTWLTAVQLIVPTELQGRYFGVDQLGSFAAIPAGLLVAGALIGIYGILPTFALAGIGLSVSTSAFLLSRDLRRLGYDRGPSEAPGGA